MESGIPARKRGSEMYCSQCGQAVGAQPNCPNCGTPTGVTVAPQAILGQVPLAVSRVARHLHTLGILWAVFAAYLALRWLLVLPLLHRALGGEYWMQGSDTWMLAPFHPGGWVLRVITIAVLIRVILSLAVGIALLSRQPWGRIFAIVVAVLTLIKPFLGTILAIYTLWVLLERNADQNYAQLAAERQAYPPAAPGSPSVG